MNLAQRIDEIITDGLISVNELAETLQISRQQIARWRNGTSEPTATNLLNFCKTYKISSDYILGLNKGLEWPREEKEKHTGNCTKCTFLHRNFWETKNRPDGLFFIVTATSYGDLPKNVIETRYGYQTPLNSCIRFN